MRISEKYLRKVIREQLIESQCNESVGDWMSDKLRAAGEFATAASREAGEASIAAALSPFLKVKTPAIDLMIPLFKQNTTEAEAVDALKSAISGPYKGDAKALIRDTLDSIPSLSGLAKAVRPFVNPTNGWIVVKPITAALKYLLKQGHNQNDIVRIARSIEDLIKKANAMSNPIEI